MHFFSHNKTHFTDSRKLTAQNVVSTQRNEKSVQQSHREYTEYFARCLFAADLFSLLINILIKTGWKSPIFTRCDSLELGIFAEPKFVRNDAGN